VLTSFLRRILISPWTIILFLTAGLGVSLASATPSPDGDSFYYQAFIEALARGQIDLSIPGFHGSSVLAVLIYWITGSAIAGIEYQMLFALFLPVLAYLAGKSLFESKWHGLVFAGIISMMPFVSAISLIGYTAAAYVGLMLLTIYGACRKSWWTWIAWGLAITTKPFALALLPILWIKRPSTGSFFARNKLILLGLLIPALYVLIQYSQVGRLIVGVHPELSETTVWQGPVKALFNVAYALQILFSVHNYHYPDPGGTGHQNMMHTTPVLIFLGLFAFFAHSKFLPDRKLYMALLLGAVIGIGMNVVVASMNHFYMQAGILFIILAALPVMKKYPIWIPFVIATLHFQWFYFYLAWGNRLQLGPLFFTAPAVVDVLFLGCLFIYWIKEKPVDGSL